jgi:TPR repeat protein
MRKLLSVCALALLIQTATHAEDPAALFSPAVRDADAQIKQGHLKEGMDMLRTAADGGDASAQYGLAHYLTKGMGHAEQMDGGKGYVVRDITNADKTEAAGLMSKAAQQGYPLAQAELGWQYEMGNPLPRHPRLARDYYAALDAKGAVSGHRGTVRANAALGKWAQAAPGSDEAQADRKIQAQDYDAAAALYLKAAQAGSPSAAYEYAVLCDRGLGVAKSAEEAKKWFLASAGQGYAPAQLELGRGKLLPDGEKLAWLTKASDAGSPQAEYWLGQSKLQGRDGTPRDEAGGWALLKKAASQEDTFAKLTLAGAYLKGSVEGFPKDLDKAATLAVEAAQDGNPVAVDFVAAVAAARGK